MLLFTVTPTLVLILLPVVPRSRTLLLVLVWFLPLLSFLCCYLIDLIAGTVCRSRKNKISPTQERGRERQQELRSLKEDNEGRPMRASAFAFVILEANGRRMLGKDTMDLSNWA